MKNLLLTVHATTNGRSGIMPEADCAFGSGRHGIDTGRAPGYIGFDGTRRQTRGVRQHYEKSLKSGKYTFVK